MLTYFDSIIFDKFNMMKIYVFSQRRVLSWVYIYIYGYIHIYIYT